jgi:hypothetical protein
MVVRRIVAMGCAASAVFMLVILPACGAKNLRDLCVEGGACVSNEGCPADPPTAGVACDIADGAECFYCLEDDRVEASRYRCEQGASDSRWKRQANLDCD